MGNKNGLTFSAKPLFDSEGYKRSYVSNAKKLRDMYYQQFKRHITLLLEQKKARKVSSQKGYLNPRVLYRHQFSDNVFQKTVRTETSDTTIIFLIDGSGSMDCRHEVNGLDVNRIGICGAVASAFAKANQTVLKNQIPIEVFIKSAPAYHGSSLTGTENGSMVTLSRVFSSHKRDANLDKLCEIQSNSPLIDAKGNYDGSYTSEYAVLPALNKWIKKNVKTKKCIVFNLTDGEAYCSLGVEDYSFRSSDTKAMRMKYLRGLPNVTLMIDGRRNDQMMDVYGENLIVARDDFSGTLFKTFSGFLE